MYMRKGLPGSVGAADGGVGRWGAGSELGEVSAKDTTNVAAGFAESSAAQVNLYAPGEEARSFALANAGGSSGERGGRGACGGDAPAEVRVWRPG